MTDLRLNTQKDLEIFSEKSDDLINTVKSLSDKTRIPSLKQKLEMNDIVLDFCRTHKRKIYGGYAMNKLIEVKNKDDVFYKAGEYADIDIYTPEPILDAMRLVNIFHEKGYENISAEEAQHSETYKVHVEFFNIADFSYVPLNVYHKMPFVTIDGINYIAAHHAIIDLLLMFSDPYSGEERWKKAFPRYITLQKYYPFVDNHKKKPTRDKLTDLTSIGILSEIKKFMLERKDSIILFGDYVYNYYKQEADDKNLINLNRYQMVSIDYKKDGIELNNMLKEKFSKEYLDISFVEYYPFWQFLDYSVEIKYKNQILAVLVGNNCKCIPIKKTYFYENSKKTDHIVNIASYDYNLMMMMMYKFRARVVEDKLTHEFFDSMIIELIKMKLKYLKDNKKTILDSTPFQDFITDCIGKSRDPRRDYRLRMNEKAKSGKIAKWTYRVPPTKEPYSDYKFYNTSGNAIIKEHNFKIKKIDKSNS
jgi:hypothetical protein